MFAYAFGDLRVVIGVRMSGEEFHLITLQQTEQVVSARKRYDRVQTGRGHRGMHGDHDLLGLVHVFQVFGHPCHLPFLRVGVAEQTDPLDAAAAVVIVVLVVVQNDVVYVADVERIVGGSYVLLERQLGEIVSDHFRIVVVVADHVENRAGEVLHQLLVVRQLVAYLHHVLRTLIHGFVPERIPRDVAQTERIHVRILRHFGRDVGHELVLVLVDVGIFACRVRGLARQMKVGEYHHHMVRVSAGDLRKREIVLLVVFVEQLLAHGREGRITRFALDVVSGGDGNEYVPHFLLRGQVIDAVLVGLARLIGNRGEVRLVDRHRPQHLLLVVTLQDKLVRAQVDRLGNGYYDVILGHLADLGLKIFGLLFRVFRRGTEQEYVVFVESGSHDLDGVLRDEDLLRIGHHEIFDEDGGDNFLLFGRRFGPCRIFRTADSDAQQQKCGCEQIR